jgi:hypothetical protein
MAVKVVVPVVVVVPLLGWVAAPLMGWVVVAPVEWRCQCL